MAGPRQTPQTGVLQILSGNANCLPGRTKPQRSQRNGFPESEFFVLFFEDQEPRHGQEGLDHPAAAPLCRHPWLKRT